MPRPVHFEICTSDPETTKEFYAKAFGWTYQRFGGDGDDPYWIVTTGPDGEMGINGGIMQREGDMPAGTTNVVGVESVDAAVETIKSAGGTITVEKMAVPGMGWAAYAIDPDGNPFGVFEMDDQAK